MAATAQQIAEVLAGLRAESARLVAAAAQPAPARLSTGLDALDALLDGGLPRGRLVELSGPRSSGRMSTTLAMTAAAQAAGELVALVDVADALDPRSAARAGVILPRLLWVRPRSVVDGLKAADWLLDVGGFGLVVLYLAGVAAQVVDAEARVGLKRRSSVVRGDAPWLKLARRAERARAAMVIVADRPLVGTLGALSLAAQRARGQWLGCAEAPRLLDGARGRLAVARNKLGPAQGSAELPLCIDLGALDVAALAVAAPRPALAATASAPEVAAAAIVLPATLARTIERPHAASPLPAGPRFTGEPSHHEDGDEEGDAAPALNAHPRVVGRNAGRFARQLAEPHPRFANQNLGRFEKTRQAEAEADLFAGGADVQTRAAKLPHGRADAPAIAVSPRLARNCGSGSAPNPGSPSFENHGFATPPARGR